MPASHQDVLSQPLTLPCGVTLKNRVAKAAMTEGLADPDGLPNEKHVRLYRTWAEGGVGLLITGNVMIDGAHQERPGNVILDHPLSPEERARFEAWARAGSTDGCRRRRHRRDRYRAAVPFPGAAAARIPMAESETDVAAGGLGSLKRLSDGGGTRCGADSCMSLSGRR